MTLPHPNKTSNPADIYENQDEKTNNSSSNKPFGSGGGLRAATLTRNKDSNPADIYLNEEDEKKPRSSSSGVTKATPPWEKNKINEISKTEKIPIEKCEKKKEPEIPSDDELYDQLNYVEMDIKKNQKMAPAKSSSSSMIDVKAAAGKFFRRGGSGDKDEEKEKEKKKEKEKTASSTVTLPPLPDRRPSTAVEVGKRNNSEEDAEDEEEYEYPDLGVTQPKKPQSPSSPSSSIYYGVTNIGSSDEKKSSAASVAAAKIGNWGANQIKKIKEIGRDSKDVSSEAGKQNRWHDVSEIPKDVDVKSFTVGEVVECLHHLHLGKYAKAFTKSQGGRHLP